MGGSFLVGRRAVQLRQWDLPPLLRRPCWRRSWLPWSGAGAGELFGRRLSLRLVAPVAIAAGVIVELVIRGHYPAQLHWLAPVLVCLGVLTIAVLALARSPRARAIALAVAVAALLLGARGVGVRHPLLCHQLDLPRRRPRLGRDRRPGLRRGRPRAIPAGVRAPAVPRRPLGCSALRARAHRPGRRAARAGPRPARAGLASGGGAPAARRSGGGFGGRRARRRRLRRQPLRRQRRLAEHRPVLHRHPRRRDARRLEPVGRGRARSSPAAPTSSGSGASPVARARSAAPGSPNEVRTGKIRWVLVEEGGPGQGTRRSGHAPRGSARSRRRTASRGAPLPRCSEAAGRAPPGGETRVGSKKVMAVVEKACSRVELSSSSSTATGSSAGRPRAACTTAAATRGDRRLTATAACPDRVLSNIGPARPAGRTPAGEAAPSVQ